MTCTRSIRVLIADECPIYGVGLRQVLGPAGIVVVGETSDGAAVAALARELEPDVLLLDVSIPHRSALAVLRDLGAAGVPARTVILTERTASLDIAAALRLGASGAICRTAAPELFLRCVRAVAAGEYWVGRASVAALVDALLELAAAPGTAEAWPFDLTPRERTVVGLVVEGYSNRVIAKELGISVETVKRHLTSAFGKTGCSTRLQLALLVLHHRLEESVEHPTVRSSQPGRHAADLEQ